MLDVITTVISKMKACEKFRCEWHLNPVLSDIIAVLHQLSPQGTVAGSLWVMFMTWTRKSLICILTYVHSVLFTRDLQDHEVLMDHGDPSALLVHLDSPWSQSLVSLECRWVNFRPHIASRAYHFFSSRQGKWETTVNGGNNNCRYQLCLSSWT